MWVDNFSIRGVDAGKEADSLSSIGPAREVTAEGGHRPAGSAPNGLVMDLRCDAGAGPGTLDHSGWGNGGLLMGPEWVRDSGRPVLRFDGIDDYVMVPHANSLNARDQVSIEVWIKPDADVGRSCRLVAKYFDMLLGLSGTRTPYQVSGAFRAAQRPGVDSKARISSERWHHLAQTYDGRKVSLFVDGVLASEADLSGEIAASLNPLFIGTYLPNEGNAWYKGLLAGVRLHRRAMTASEVATHSSRPPGSAR